MIDEEPRVDVNGDRKRSIILEGSKSSNSSSTDVRSKQNNQVEVEEIPVAEPVGNFIRDQALVLNSTRIHRFTEKYRDSVVDRILAGKVSISSLTTNGEFGEAELKSWIADKAKRQEEKRNA